MRIVLALLLSLLIPSVASAKGSAIETYACELDGLNDPSVVNIAPLSDERVRGIFNDVLRISEISPQIKFVLCEYDSSPYFFAATSLLYQNLVIIEVERGMSRYDEKVLRGMFAHELGHVYLGHIYDRRGPPALREIAADRRGAQVVGRESMIETLKAVRNVLPDRLTGNDLLGGYREVDRRMDALQE